MEVQLLSFLTLELDGYHGQLRAPRKSTVTI